MKKLTSFVLSTLLATYSCTAMDQHQQKLILAIENGIAREIRSLIVNQGVVIDEESEKRAKGKYAIAEANRPQTVGELLLRDKCNVSPYTPEKSKKNFDDIGFGIASAKKERTDEVLKIILSLPLLPPALDQIIVSYNP